MNPGDVGPNRGLKLAVQQGLAALFATMVERKTQVTVRMWKAMLMATLHSWRDTVVASTFQHAFRTALGAAPHEKAGELVGRRNARHAHPEERARGAHHHRQGRAGGRAPEEGGGQGSGGCRCGGTGEAEGSRRPRWRQRPGSR